MKLDVISVEQVLRHARITVDMHDLSLRHGIDVDPDSVPDSVTERQSRRFFRVSGYAWTLFNVIK